MKIYQGKSILKGITIGKILYYSKEEQMVQRRSGYRGGMDTL